MTLYTKAELLKKSKSDLVELADKHDLDIEDVTKAQLIEELLTIEESDDEVDDELDDIADPVLDDDEVDDEEQDEVEETTTKTTKKTTKAVVKSSDDNTLAAKQVAALVGTDAKTIRQFFRSPASTIEPVGSGGRYEFLETDVPKIKEEFAAWSTNRGKRASAGTGGKSSKRARNEAKVEQEIEEVEEIEELEEAELEDLNDDDIELDD